MLKISGWTPYSLANTNGTMPWGKAACAKFTGLIFLRRYNLWYIFIYVTNYNWLLTWTIATLSNKPLIPITYDESPINEGPKTNLSANDSTAMRVPHAMILDREAVKSPNMEWKNGNNYNAKLMPCRIYDVCF